MTKVNEILAYLRENPRATNKEIAEELKMDSDNVKATIWKLKDKGYIEVLGQGVTRTITVLKEMPASKHSYKKEIIETMIGKYMEDFEDCGTLNDRIEVGKVILRLLEKL